MCVYVCVCVCVCVCARVYVCLCMSVWWWNSRGRDSKNVEKIESDNTDKKVMAVRLRLLESDGKMDANRKDQRMFVLVQSGCSKPRTRSSPARKRSTVMSSVWGLPPKSDLVRTHTQTPDPSGIPGMEKGKYPRVGFH